MLLAERFTIGRLARQHWSRCEIDSTSLVPRSRCGKQGQDDKNELERLGKIIREISRTENGDTDRLALHVRALFDLRFAPRSPTSLDRAVASLETARRVGLADAELLNDLAVCYLEVAVRDQQLAPLLRALDVVDQARRHDSTLAEPRFNRALILESLYLVSRAQTAWSEILLAEPGREWRQEANEHLQRLSRFTDDSRRGADPQQARDDSFRLIAEWGRRTLRQDSVGANHLLDSARTTSDSLDRWGSDASVALAVNSLASTRSRPAMRDALAHAFIDFETGLALVDSAAYERADSVLKTAERDMRRLDCPTVRWVAYARAVAEANSGDDAGSGALLRTILRDASPAEPAVRGKALWLLGVIELRNGNYEIANRHYDQALPLFVRAKDRKNEAAIAWLLTESLALAGQTAMSLNEGFLGLRGLAAFRGSIYLSNHLTTVASIARAADLPSAAAEIVDEALDVAVAGDRSDALAVVLGTRARDLATSGNSAGAQAALDRAERAARRLDGSSRRFALAGVDFERGRLWRLGAADSAGVRLVRAANGFRDLKRWLYVVPALYERAMVAMSEGDLPTARESLAQAIAVVEHQRASFSTAESRSAFYETAEGVFDAMIELELDAGRPQIAFQYLERGRIAVLPSSRRSGTSVSISDVGRSLPPATLFVSYAVLRDRTVIWWQSRRASGQQSIRITRDSLRALVDRLAERNPTSRASDAARSRLFSILIDPVRFALGGVHQLAIAPDRELSDVSFATLFDSRTGKFVVEDFTVRIVPSGEFVVAANATSVGFLRSESALVVGDPAGPRSGPGSVAALRGAQVEARRVAAIYRGSTLLTGDSADRDRVVAALPLHSIFHFAGHAIFDRDQPELSYLALAGDSAVPRALRAREIATMRLSKVRLVVLSACATLKSRPSRSGAVAGLAYSFLRAGVPRTISTLWDISDDAVVGLLVELHARVVRGVEPREALRLAQLAALHSDRAERRSPAVWGAFIYTGP